MPSLATTFGNVPALAATAVCPDVVDHANTAPRPCVITTTALRATILAERVNREGVGSVGRSPIAAGINISCDLCTVGLQALSANHHSQWLSFGASCVQLLKVLITACPY